MTSVIAEIKCNDKCLKDVRESVDFTKKNLNGYVDKLRLLQKNVNAALTELVEHEKLNQSVTDNLKEDEEADDDEDDSDDDETKNKQVITTKRKIATYGNNKKLKN